MHEVSFREAIIQAIDEQMEKDPSIFMIGENIGKAGGVYQHTKGLYEKFKMNRVIDMPISESGFFGAAIGAALTGTRPIVDIMFSDFLPLIMDQLVNHAVKMRYMYGGKASVPLVVRTFCGAGTSLSCTHSQSFESWFIHCPGLKVVMPSTPADAKGLMNTSIQDDDPVLFIEHRLLYSIKGNVPDNEYLIPFGKGDLKREGKDITVVANGMMVQHTMAAAEYLSKEGIEIEVIDPRTLNPLDVDIIINSVKKTNRLAIVHEAPQTGGIGAEIAAIAAKDAFGYLDAPIERICPPDIPIPFSPVLEKNYLIGKDEIVRAIKMLLN